MGVLSCFLPATPCTSMHHRDHLSHLLKILQWPIRPFQNKTSLLKQALFLPSPPHQCFSTSFSTFSAIQGISFIIILVKAAPALLPYLNIISTWSDLVYLFVPSSLISNEIKPPRELGPVHFVLYLLPTF